MNILHSAPLEELLWKSG